MLALSRRLFPAFLLLMILFLASPASAASGTLSVMPGGYGASTYFTTSQASQFAAANDWSAGIQLTPRSGGYTDVTVNTALTPNLQLPAVPDENFLYSIANYRILTISNTQLQSIEISGPGNQASISSNASFSLALDNLVLHPATSAFVTGIPFNVNAQILLEEAALLGVSNAPSFSCGQLSLARGSTCSIGVPLTLAPIAPAQSHIAGSFYGNQLELLTGASLFVDPGAYVSLSGLKTNIGSSLILNGGALTFYGSITGVPSSLQWNSGSLTLDYYAPLNVIASGPFGSQLILDPSRNLDAYQVFVGAANPGDPSPLLKISGGAYARIRSLFIVDYWNPGGPGSVIIDGQSASASSLLVADSVHVGSYIFNSNIPGTLEISNQGRLVATTVFVEPGCSITLNNGTLTAGFLVLDKLALDPAQPTVSGGGTINASVQLLGTLSASNPAVPLLVHGRIAGAGDVHVAPNSLLVSDALIVNSLAIEHGGTAQIRSNGYSSSTLLALTLDGAPNAWTAKFDISNNTVQLRPTSATKDAALATLADQVRFARNNGLWNKNGITSTTVAANPSILTLAVVDNADLHLSTYAGLSLDDNSLLLTPALTGDANLDHTVDLADYDLWYKHVGGPANATSKGDFNLDNNIDLADYDAWYQHVGATLLLTPDLPPLAPSPIPEPTSLFILLALPLLRRRR